MSERKPYRVTFACTLDAWAEDDDDAVEQVVNQLADDGFPISWLELFGIMAEQHNEQDNWWPINERDDNE